VAADGRVEVPGTEPTVPGGDVIGALEPSTRLEVTVMVRPRQSLQELDARLSQAPLGDRPGMSREEFAASYGADPDDLVSVETFARAHGLQVVETAQARRSIKLRGTAAAFSEAFGIQIRRYRDASGRTFRAPDRAISVPTELAGVVQGVFGFDDRPAARRR
jgi:kumamolisin